MKAILNVHQLPDMQFVGQVDMTGKGLKKIMAYAEDRLINYNQVCTLAEDEIDAYAKTLAIPWTGRTHARRAGKMRCQDVKWLKAFMNRIAAIKNRYHKCLGGE